MGTSLRTTITNEEAGILAITAGTVTEWERAAAVAVDPYPASRNCSSSLFSLQETSIFLSRRGGEQHQEHAMKTK